MPLEKFARPGRRGGKGKEASRGRRERAPPSQQTDMVPEKSLIPPGPVEVVTLEEKFSDEEELGKEAFRGRRESTLPSQQTDMVPEESVILVKEPALVEDVTREENCSEEELEVDSEIRLLLRTMECVYASKMPLIVYRMSFAPWLKAKRREMVLASQQPSTVPKESDIISRLFNKKMLELPRYKTPEVKVDYSMCQTFEERKEWLISAVFIQRYRAVLAKRDAARCNEFHYLAKRDAARCNEFHYLTDEEIRMMLDQEE